MEAKHTPGPWYFGGSGYPESDDSQRNGWYLGDPDGDCLGPCETEREAEMLAALRDLYTHCSMIHKHWGDGCNREQADRAIQAGRAILERAGVQP